MVPQLLPAPHSVPVLSRRARPTGLTEGTLIQTAEGPLPVEYLLGGDRIVTQRGIVELRGTSVLIAQDADVVVIDPEAPLVGDAIRERPLIVPAHQQVLVNDWRATILHGQSAMLTPAASLVDDALVRRERRARLRLFRLHFDVAQVIQANGCAVASARTRAPEVERRRHLH